MELQRLDGRPVNALRPLRFQRHFTGQAAGSVLTCMGRTMVLCTCSVEPTVPEFLVGTGKGWLTAEYAMLPGSTRPRKARDRSGKIDGRSVEIQRLIGRSLRAVVDLAKLGERTLWIDCDVLEADGGTRTASVNGGFLALLDALLSLRDQLPCPVNEIVRSNVAAVSVGLRDGLALLDLDYAEDKDVDVDLNLVMTGSGEVIEVQAGGEEATFSLPQLEQLLNLGKQGILEISQLQRAAFGTEWPLDAPRTIC
ncbi:MAG: ribonuclease PH [Gemmatales bacterium]|nr:ribonuclease PH [Gemmatales bacterium]MDW8388197.1 ribonuclease PH [Gemmatales bacterium]